MTILNSKGQKVDHVLPKGTQIIGCFSAALVTSFEARVGVVVSGLDMTA